MKATEKTDIQPRLRFNRGEWSGSMGDIGTDLPLLLGMLLATDLHPASVLILFGALQILTGLMYGLPMPMQPLKAMAVLIITEQLSGDLIFAAGLTIGGIMLFLSVSGLLRQFARLIPACVVRGVQFGLGLSLASLALKTYVPAMGVQGYAIAGAGFLLLTAFWRHPRIPAGLILLALGAGFALWRGWTPEHVVRGIALDWPHWQVPNWSMLWPAFLVLVLPQLPLSISNSVIATDQTVRDLFPERNIGVRRIGITYGIVNLLAPFFGGIPVCHGCGGLAGHYAFGGRTGGSVIIYGTFYIILGLFFSGVLENVLELFPQPILGVVLLVEALTLLALIRDQASNPRNLLIALLVGVCALTLPQGYLVGLLTGTLLYYGFSAFGRSEPGRGG